MSECYCKGLFPAVRDTARLLQETWGKFRRLLSFKLASPEEPEPMQAADPGGKKGDGTEAIARAGKKVCLRLGMMPTRTWDNLARTKEATESY